MKTSFDPRAICDAVIAAWTPLARQKNLALAPLIYGNVPAQVNGDAGPLLHALHCLTQNAIAASASAAVSGGRITLAMTGASETGAKVVLRCAVSDSGAGFDAAEAAQISNRLREQSGESGLAVVGRLVLQMGGEIGLESTPGRGSTFWFTARFEVAGDDKIAPAPKRAPLAFESEKIRLLIAEDDPINQRIALHQLAKLGFEADVVGNGAEALQWLARARYDLIFLDCQMPELDGYDTARAIRHRNGAHQEAQRPIIVALTSLDSPRNRQKCFEAGMDDFLAKPLERGALCRCLRRWLGAEFDPGHEESELSQSELLVQLIPLFLEDAPTRLHSMRQALKTQNLRALEQAAHTLKGSSALMGVARMSKLCEVLENLGESGSFQGARQFLDQLENEFVAVRRDLQAQLDLDHSQ